MNLFVWDFHGVLEKDNDLAVLEVSNQVLKQAGYTERFSPQDNRKYYGLKWYQYFEQLLPNLGREQHLALQAACFKFAEDNLWVLKKYIKPNDYSLDVLEAIKQAGHDQVIISNTRPSDLEWFVSAVHQQKYFPTGKLFGVNAHQSHSVKEDALRDYIKDKSFSRFVIIGDSLSDMALKEVGGGVSYLYSQPGISTPSDITADHIITDLRKVLQEL